MADFPYVNNPASLKRFLEHVQKAGVPEKVTLDYLKAAGFKSTNDRPILRVLKSIGFVNNAGEPSETWARYRHKGEAPKVLAAAIRSTYSGLFEMYGDANRKDDDALRDFFSSNSKSGDAALTLMVRTFKALCGLADFEAVSDEGRVAKSRKTSDSEMEKLASTKLVDKPNAMTVNINIQLTLSATDDAEVYEKLFAAMKKHLAS